jgi:hypothetical protein
MLPGEHEKIGGGCNEPECVCYGSIEGAGVGVVTIVVGVPTTRLNGGGITSVVVGLGGTTPYGQRPRMVAVPWNWLGSRRPQLI